MNSNESSSFFTAVSPVLMQAMPMKHIEGSTNGVCDLFTIEKDGKRRVLKCLETKFRGKAAYEALLRKEYEIGYSLSCPYICDVYSFLEHPTLGNCIEMEWIDGIPLDKYLQSVVPSNERKLRLLNQLLDAVSYFHSKQVVHKDLKPSNILVTHNGSNIKIIDFGFADKDVYSILKLSAGTEKYAAPELIAGKPVDNRADIYSLGKILLLFGSRWHGVARKCLQDAPAKRYGSVEELRRALATRRFGWFWILLAIIVSGLAVYLFVPRPDPAIEPVVEETKYTQQPLRPDNPVKPEVSVKPVPVPVQETPAVQPPEKSVTSEVDRIVKEATGLFQPESN